MDAFAWPSAIIIFLVVFVLIFKEKIGLLIDRMNSVKLPGGFHADASGQGRIPAQEPQSPNELSIPAKVPVGPPPHNEITAALEEEARTLLTSQFPDNEMRLAWAIRAYALVTMEKTHETNYRLILGSQIAVLKRINQAGHLVLPAIKETYEGAAEAYPEQYANFPFDSWWHFLTQCNYVQLNAQGAAEVTMYGRDFLMWMAGRGVFENKGL